MSAGLSLAGGAAAGGVATIPIATGAAVTAIVAVCKPDHMNVESLGNVMPHLHWHVIPRYKRDGRWGQPIWAPDVKAQPERKLLLPQLKKGKVTRKQVLDIVKLKSKD